MGNRAVITNTDEKVGIYLHWNGGRDSVEAFLKYCDLQGFRSLTKDPQYGFARLSQIICNWFGGGLSCGVGEVARMDCDNGDNGMYIVDGWKIVDRKYHDGPEQMSYDLEEMLLDINSQQPEHMRLEESLIKSEAEKEKEKRKTYAKVSSKSEN